MSTWEYKKPILKKVRFEKKLTPYPHFIVYHFEAILALFNEHPTDERTYLSSQIPISIVAHDTLSKEPKYLVGENPEHLTEQFIEVLTEKEEAIAADVLKQDPYLSDFQMLPGEVQKHWRQWVNQVPVMIGFNSGKYDLNMVKEYFVKYICYSKTDECNEDVFAAKKDNNF